MLPFHRTTRARSTPALPRSSAARRAIAALAALPLLALAACSSGAGASTAPGTTSAATELRLGYFANVTHAPALVGVSKGLFADELGSTTLTTQVFNAGPAAIEALNAGAIDAAFLGPNPAINGFITSKGASLRIVAGST